MVKKADFLYDGLKVVALAGGVGGARMAHGLANVLHPKQLTVIVNTADDLIHWGLYICPDVDTVMYTLSGRANTETGWGVAGDTFYTLKNMKFFDEPTWFQIGDKDLALHMKRTALLNSGMRLTRVIKDLCLYLGVRPRVLPMTDTPVRTIVRTSEGDLSFQEYFVHRHCEPAVQDFYWQNGDRAEMSMDVKVALREADLIVIGPSNPLVSIDPILHIPGVEDALKNKVTVAVSPIIGGKVVKGPLAKMMQELDMPATAGAVCTYYEDIIRGFVFDPLDEADSHKISSHITPLVTPILIPALEDRKRLAKEVIEFGIQLGAGAGTKK